MVLRLLPTVYHLALGSIFWFTIYYDLYRLRIPDVLRIRHENSAGRWKYLTFWNLISQAIFFTLSFVNDVLASGRDAKKPPTQLQKFIDSMFVSVGFPISIFVGSSFWFLMSIDRELVLPTIFDTFFPSWLNHLMHTLIIPAVLIEMTCIYHKYPSRKCSLTVLSFFTAIYCIWTLVVAYVWQFWTYPILEVLNWGQRVGFIVLCTAFTWICYFGGEFLHKLLWKSQEKQSSRRKKKH